MAQKGPPEMKMDPFLAQKRGLEVMLDPSFLP